MKARVGTAVSVLPNVFAVGARGNLYGFEELVIRDILAECDGVVRWAADDKDYPMEGFFYLDRPPGDALVASVASKLRGWNSLPSEGAGIIRDPLSAKRRAAAKNLQSQQKRPR